MANMFRCGGDKKLKEQTITVSKSLKGGAEVDSYSTFISLEFTELKEVLGLKNIQLPDGDFGISGLLNDYFPLGTRDDNSYYSISGNIVKITLLNCVGETRNIVLSVTAIGY